MAMYSGRSSSGLMIHIIIIIILFANDLNNYSMASSYRGVENMRKMKKRKIDSNQLLRELGYNLWKINARRRDIVTNAEDHMIDREVPEGPDPHHH